MIEFNGPSISHQKGLSPFNTHATSSMFASFSGSWTSCSIQSWLACWSPVSLQSSLSIWRPSSQRFSSTNARCDFEEFVVYSSLFNAFILLVRRMKELMLNKRSCLKRIKCERKIDCLFYSVVIGTKAAWATEGSDLAAPCNHGGCWHHVDVRVVWKIQWLRISSSSAWC